MPLYSQEYFNKHFRMHRETIAVNRYSNNTTMQYLIFKLFRE